MQAMIAPWNAPPSTSTSARRRRTRLGVHRSTAPRAARFAEGLRSDRPVLDVGCGPGGYLPDLLASGAPVVALDAARAMLDLAHDTAPMALRLRADMVALPFRPFSLGAAWARATPISTSVGPPAGSRLAHLHHSLALEAPVVFSVVDGDDEGPVPGDAIAGRFFADWRRDAAGRRRRGRRRSTCGRSSRWATSCG